MISLIELGELDQIAYHTRKCFETANSLPLSGLLSELEKPAPFSLMQEMMKLKLLPNEWKNESLNQLELEIETMHGQLFTYIQEKLQLEILIQNYEKKFYERLGQFILELNKISPQKQNLDAPNYFYKKPSGRLSENALLVRFKEISRLCHPIEETKMNRYDLRAIYKQAELAYSDQDGKTLTKLLLEIKKQLLTAHSETLNPSDEAALKLELQELSREIDEYRLELELLKTHDAFQTIRYKLSIDDYLDGLEREIIEQIAYLKEKRKLQIIL